MLNLRLPGLFASRRGVDPAASWCAFSSHLRSSHLPAAGSGLPAAGGFICGSRFLASSLPRFSPDNCFHLDAIQRSSAGTLPKVYTPDKVLGRST